jgi:hypothetical protein
MTFCDLEARLLVALGDNDEAELDACREDIGSGDFCGLSFPDQLFSVLMDILDSDEAARSELTWRLILMFEVERHRLNDDQRARLFAVLERAYLKFFHWMSHFIVTEVLCTFAPPEAVLECLCRLGASARGAARVCLPHGFEHVVEGADGVVRQLAIEQLRLLACDEDAEVRSEVRESLGRLKGKDIVIELPA